MLINNLDPIFISLGPIEIRYYGLIYALGFLIGIFFFKYFAKKKILPLTDEKINDFFFWLIIGIVIGARIFEVFVWYPSYYLANPSKILAVWNGGLSFHGALLGGIIVTYYFTKKNNISFLRFLDLLVIPATLATALGRLGNFFNSELYGYQTNLPWCVVFKKVDNLCRHPYQIYSFLKRTLIFGYLFYLLKAQIHDKNKGNYKKNKTDGYIFWNFIFLMGLGRFLIDFTRVDKLYFGLSTGQWLSLSMAIIAFYFLITKYWKVKKIKNNNKNK